MAHVEGGNRLNSEEIRVKVFIVGSTGFLGSNLVRQFAAHSVVKTAPSFSPANPGRWQRETAQSLLDFKPDIVLLAGGAQSAQDDEASIRSLLDSNCYFPALIARLLVSKLPKTKLVTFGTAWQFADSDDYRPFNLYAASKQACADILTHYALLGLSILQLILFDTYGPNDPRRKLLNILKDASVSGTAIPTTSGEQEIDLVHIDDVCHGVECAIRELDEWDPSKGLLTLGLGSKRPIRVRELIDRISNENKHPTIARIGELPYRPREVMRVYTGYQTPREWEPSIRDFHRVIV
jgi:nucleoside-diphosphate-sugar epimerase